MKVHSRSEMKDLTEEEEIEEESFIFLNQKQNINGIFKLEIAAMLL